MRRGEVKKVSFTYSEKEMIELYQELTICFRALDVDFAGNRGKYDLPHLYVMYDDLYSIGIS